MHATTGISGYAIIGDCRAAALVSRLGAIDWLCWPRFESPSVFGRLLDPSAGHWTIRPTAPCHTTRRYVPDTNVLHTTFRTSSGSVTLIDLMTVAREEDKHEMLLPEHELLRVVQGNEGVVELEVVFEPRPGYGVERPRLRMAGKLGLRVETRQGLLALQTDSPLEILFDGTARTRVRVRAGESRSFSLTFSEQWPAVLPPVGAWSRQAITRSIRWWRDWVSRVHRDGPARAAVVRSALTLKLLVYAPSGAVVAAPTTSLPERPGGDLNWDYRYCWLRDASMTVRALFGLGFEEEANAFVSWLLHSTRLTQPQLRVLYDVYGNDPKSERVLEHLSGYRGARPVRVGNAAAHQLQLDVYGEVIDAAALFAQHGHAFDTETRDMLRAFGLYVCHNWDRPDEGIWEPRTSPKHNTHSRVLCWIALDRLLDLHARGLLPDIPTDDIARNREMIRREVETRGWNEARQSYVSHLDGTEVDASLLMLSWHGFDPPSSHRMTKTYARIRRELGAGDGLLYRHARRSPETAGEGAFGICSFWGAEYLALGGGTVEAATTAFEQLCDYGNDVGLFGEEIDPTSGEALGNFPQAFSHIGLINAALSVDDRLRLEGSKPRRPDRALDEPRPEGRP
jgi:GH15 family glucan-1,4-alpha-glucosidase